MSAKPTPRSPRQRPDQPPPSRGRADVARMMAMSEAEIMRTSPPELRDLPEDFWDDAVIVPPLPKQPISLRVDPDVLAWFKQQGPGYQSRMNAVLRSYMERMRTKPETKGRRKGKAATRA